MRFQTFIYLLAILFLSACGPVVTPPPTATPSPTPVISGVPELLISSVYLGMQGLPGQGGGCVSNYGPFEIRASIQNLSETPAYNIEVVEHSTGTTLTITELGPWQTTELIFPAVSSNGSYNVEVDPENLIPESNEQNNTFSYLAPTPTPPALCTPTPTPAPAESTPIASLTPAPATEPASSLQPLVVWQSPGSPCKTASFWADHMESAACGEISATVPAQLDDYVSRYSILMQAYAPFTAETPAGSVTFNGHGFVIAT
ncbi:MAG TPA: CARDB domain-containing protein, partial [Anaerolineales bacterium]|nr:CARDB domain-containing protein [Anaerolineales bacterium]